MCDHVSQTVLECNSPQLSEVDPAEFWPPWLLQCVQRKINMIIKAVLALM